MRRGFLDIARCPVCHQSGTFVLDLSAEDEREVREAAVTCASCGEVRWISRGVVDLMPSPPDFVRREAGGLDRFADLMRADGWDRDRVLSLPHEQSGYWFVQSTAMNQVLATVPFQPGDRILDVGSNTCWASAMFAERGLDVVALDINAGEMQGLATSDWWFEDKDIYFERMLGLMFDISLADGVLDYVWCCEVLHHNDVANLRRTFRELYRVLKPGGRLLVVNETLRTLRDPKFRPGKDVAQFEGHEHAYVRNTYLRAARAAGFELDVRPPWIHPIFTDWTVGLRPGLPLRTGARALAAHIVRGNPRLSRAYLAWKAYVVGGTALYVFATKPAAVPSDRADAGARSV